MEISNEFIDKYNKPGPRYTSYPPATLFSPAFDNSKYLEHISLSNSQNPKNISVYIHIPFCPQQCSFCGCTTVIGKGKSVIQRYVEAVIKEIKTVSSLLDNDRKLTQIHWGGGTPNSIPFEYIESIMLCLKENFTFHKNIEIAIECSPAYLNLSDIDKLASYGFNRMSLGIQDFDDKVLEIVNRKPSKFPVKDIIKKLRENGFRGINIDLIYGLPGQTVESFLESIKKTIEINPDRIVTFSYAHVPWVKEYQKKLEDVGLPSPEEKMTMLTSSLTLLTKSGYDSIGMDHYAKPEDDISLALKEKKLHRNFQGYCTLETTGQVYGFGASSIGQLQTAYIQNEKNIDKYIKSIESGELAVERGYELSRKEEITRDVINEVMCNNYLDFNTIATEYNTTVDEIKNIVSYDESKFMEFIEDGLLTISGDIINVHEKGRLIVRNIAMQFDPALVVGNQIYSKTV